MLDILFTSHEVPRQEVFLISQVLNFSSEQIFPLAPYFKHKMTMNFAQRGDQVLWLEVLISCCVPRM